MTLLELEARLLALKVDLPTHTKEHECIDWTIKALNLLYKVSDDCGRCFCDAIDKIEDELDKL